MPDPERWLAEVRRSPADHGRLELIVRRPSVEEREIVESGELDVTVGLVGDNWLDRGSRATSTAPPIPSAAQHHELAMRPTGGGRR